MTQDRHGEINDNVTLMLANAQHPMKRMDRSNCPQRLYPQNSARAQRVLLSMEQLAALWRPHEEIEL